MRKKSGLWAISLKAEPVTYAWLANQIWEFRNPARSDAWKKKNKKELIRPAQMLEKK